jgi:hypothetical protein
MVHNITFSNNAIGTGASLISSVDVSHIIEFNGSSDYVEILDI